MRRLPWLVVLTACGSSPAQPTGCPAGVLVVTTDYQSSEVGVLPLDGSPAQLLGGSELGADPALSVTASGRTFLIARDRNTLFELDGCGRGIGEYSALAQGETNVDPQDVDLAGDGSLWITRLFVSSLLVQGKTGAAAGTVDVSSLDGDGNPNQSAVRLLQTASGEKAFVALDRLDNGNVQLPSIQPSQLAVIDTQTRAVEKIVTLLGRNPFGPMVVYRNALWLADMGNRDADHEADAGIEVFSPDAGTSTLLISEAALGGSVLAIALQDGCGVAIAYDASSVNHTFLVSFDDAGHLVQAPALGPTTGFDLRGLYWTAAGELLVGDTRAVHGGFAVHVFSRDSSCKLVPTRDLLVPMAPLAFAAAAHM